MSVCQALYERYKDYRSQVYSVEEAAKLSKGANPATITPGSSSCRGRSSSK